MNSRIARIFEQLQQRGERALIPYLTAGFPAPGFTLPLLDALVRGGADIIELGVPFSDPIADGPTIQRASQEALAAGTTLQGILEMVHEFRRKHDTPIVLFGAYNPFFHYGLERFAGDAARAGTDAVLVPDLPVEECAEAAHCLSDKGLHLICLVAPTTTSERKALIAQHASGFIYYISVKGVTGARNSASFKLDEPIRDLRRVTNLPVVVGFGIARPDQAAEVAQYADGVVVGSALIDLISANRGEKDLGALVEEYTRAMKAPLIPASASRN